MRVKTFEPTIPLAGLGQLLVLGPRRSGRTRRAGDAVDGSVTVAARG